MKYRITTVRAHVYLSKHDSHITGARRDKFYPECDRLVSCGQGPTVARTIDLSIREAEEHSYICQPASVLQARPHVIRSPIFAKAQLASIDSRQTGRLPFSVETLCPSDSSYLAKRSFSDPFKHMVLGEHDGPLSGPPKSIDAHFCPPIQAVVQMPRLWYTG